MKTSLCVKVLLGLGIFYLLSACASSPQAKYASNEVMNIAAPSKSNSNMKKNLKDGEGDLIIHGRFVPYRAPNSNGEIKGFRCVSVLTDEPNNSFFKAGLEAGDIVLAVDSTDLNDKEKAFAALLRVVDNSYSSIRVLRGERAFTLKKVNFNEEEG